MSDRGNVSGVPSLTEGLLMMAAAADNADVDLRTDVGAYEEMTQARLWRGQVLVDWEPDPDAGGCLVRPALVERLLALHATVEQVSDETFRIVASGRVVAALTGQHKALVTRLGGARRVELELLLTFGAGHYRGGRETYFLAERGRRAPLVRMAADIRPRTGRAGAESPHTSREPS